MNVQLIKKNFVMLGARMARQFSVTVDGNFIGNAYQGKNGNFEFSDFVGSRKRLIAHVAAGF